MTVGIYALYWEKQDLIYVGQSQNIEIVQHILKMRRSKHSNYKVQQAFQKYGVPNLYILEKCLIDRLNELEILWTQELDSLNSTHGLNIIEAGCVGFGINSNNSKWTLLQILLIFKLLTRSSYFTYEEIAQITKTNESLVKDISTGKSHVWLKDKYPYLYSKIRAGRKQRNSLSYFSRINGKDCPIVISPEGIEYKVTNIREFALQHKLYNTHLGEVIRKHRKSHKGWVLKPTAV